MVKISYDVVSPAALVEYLPASNPAQIIWLRTTRQTEEEIARNFFEKGIAILDKAQTEMRAKYPRLFS